jgi:hypothetical protein
MASELRVAILRRVHLGFGAQEKPRTRFGLLAAAKSLCEGLETGMLREISFRTVNSGRDAEENRS